MNKLQSRMKISPRRVLIGLAALALAPAVGAQTRPKPQRPVDVPPAVVVLPVDTTAGDSIRTIIHRDLDFGDRVQPVLLDSAVAADVWHPGKRSINFGPLKETRAKFAVRIRPISTGLRVEIFDVARARLLQAGSFRLPRVPRDRSKTLRDSLDRAVAARAAVVRTRLAADSVALDTLARAEARPVPLERPSQRTAARIAAAARDSLRQVIERRRVTLRESSERDIARADSIYSVNMTRDSIVRDSLYREGRLAVHGVSDELDAVITGSGRGAETGNVLIRVCK